MAPIGGPTGGGQAGFGGGSFTGPAEALELAGDFCYSYSGVVAVSGSLTTCNKFTTGNYTAEVVVDFHGTFAQIGQDQIQFEVKMNGSQIINTTWVATLDASFLDFPSRLIIPPYTEIEVSLSQASGSDRNMETTITGRIYRG